MTARGPAPENTKTDTGFEYCFNSHCSSWKYSSSRREVLKLFVHSAQTVLYFQRDLKDDYPITVLRLWKEITLRTQNDLNKIVNDSNLTNEEMETFLRT